MRVKKVVQKKVRIEEAMTDEEGEGVEGEQRSQSPPLVEEME